MGFADFALLLAFLSAYHPLVLYLTFDDGPAKHETAKVLDVLKAEGIKAAFFVQTHAWNRGNTPEGQALLARMHEEGHAIQIHTGSDGDHVAHTKRVMAPAYDVTGDGVPDGANALGSDLLRAIAHIKQYGGQTRVTRVRPPGLDFGQQHQNLREKILATYHRVGLRNDTLIFSSGDTARIPPEEIRRGVLRRVEGSDQHPTLIYALRHHWPSLTMLFHDIKKPTGDHLSEYVRDIRAIAKQAHRLILFRPKFD